LSSDFFHDERRNSPAPITIITHNGYGLLLWRLWLVSPELLLNKVTDVDDKNYCLALKTYSRLCSVADMKNDNTL
jgi:hypothetical protein